MASKGKINVMKWPAQPPDSTIQRLSSNHDKLFEIISDVWGNIPQDVIDKLIASMSKGCQEVVKQKGFPTHYYSTLFKYSLILKFGFCF